jgi:hypothetical protein
VTSLGLALFLLVVLLLFALLALARVGFFVVPLAPGVFFGVLAMLFGVLAMLSALPAWAPLVDRGRRVVRQRARAGPRGDSCSPPRRGAWRTCAVAAPW